MVPVALAKGGSGREGLVEMFVKWWTWNAMDVECDGVGQCWVCVCRCWDED